MAKWDGKKLIQCPICLKTYRTEEYNIQFFCIDCQKMIDVVTTPPRVN